MKTIDALTKSFESTLELANDETKGLRIKAFEEFSKTGIPTRKQEYWKFSDPSVILNLELSHNDSISNVDEDYDLILCNGKIVKNQIKSKTGNISEGI